MSHRTRSVPPMELVPPSESSSEPNRWNSYWVGRTAVVLACILIAENWKIVVGLLATTASVLLFGLVVGVVVVVRKVTRPVEQLTVLDVVLGTWLYRSWERHKTRRQTGRPGKVTPIR